MAELLRPACSDLVAAGFDQERAATEVWEALLSAGACKEVDFVMASRQRATLKVDAEVLNKKPRQRAVILGHVATFPCIAEAEVLLYVPEGMKQFTNELGKELGKPVAQAERLPGSTSRYEFRFASKVNRALALDACRVRILEDVVSTLGSVAGMVRLLEPDKQEIHSLAFLRRGVVDPAYQQGCVDHYLAERELPLNKADFVTQLSLRDEALYYQGRQST